MATLQKSVLGKISGSIGDLTFRQKNGKSVIAVKPNSFTPGNDPDSIARREKFGLAIKMAKTINDIPELKAVWQDDTPASLSTYNYIMSSLYSYVDGGKVNDTLSLLPSIGFQVTVQTCTIGQTEIAISVSPLGERSGIDVGTEPQMKLIGLLSLSDPTLIRAEKNMVLRCSSDVLQTTVSDPIAVTIPFNSIEAQLVQSYGTVKWFFVIITLNDKGKIISYSNTSVKSIQQ